MQFQWSDLIARAKVYLDDDHQEQGGWIASDKLMTIAQVEYANLYRRWVRMGLVRPAPTDTTFNVDSTGKWLPIVGGLPAPPLTGVLAIVGVAEDLGNFVRLLRPAQSLLGPDPFWKGSTPYTYKAQAWAAHGSGDNLYLELDTADTSTTYTVRWVPTVPYATDTSTIIELPYGGDERLVLGIARRALVKESAISRQLEQLMMEAEAEMSLESFARAAGGPRVRRVRRVRTYPQRFSTFPTYPTDASQWYYA
jgi:hypothetical protein